MDALYASPLVGALMEMASSGDFSRLDKNTAKRHHFLPQFLLRNFSQEYKGKECLFQMETANRRAPRRVAVRTAASRHQLYRAFDENGQSSNRNEGYLALVETHAAPALRRLLEDPASPPPGDRATIAYFVALQIMRTPAAADQITMVANAALQSVASEFYSDRRAFADHHREFYGDGASEEKIEGFRQEVMEQIRDGRVRLNGDGGAAFATGLLHAIEQVPMLMEFDWALLLAADGGFITSDRGYAIDDPTPPYPWAAQGFLSSENSETTMPLSETACLLLRPPSSRGGGLTVHDATPTDVEAINLRTYGWADEYVFGRTQDNLVAVRVAARRRPADVICPRPFAQVALLDPDPDDNSLAEANLSRGWPAQLPDKIGDLHDYVVIPTDEPHPDRWKMIDELTERRARKRAGVGPDEPFEGRITNHPLDPLDIAG